MFVSKKEYQKLKDEHEVLKNHFGQMMEELIFLRKTVDSLVDDHNKKLEKDKDPTYLV
ncbi:MAG: hypothetical protein ACQEUO_10975 [Bacillota bacterium]